jgi:hypothetical protein
MSTPAAAPEAREPTDDALITRRDQAGQWFDEHPESASALADFEAADDDLRERFATLRAQAVAGAADTARIEWLESTRVRVYPAWNDTVLASLYCYDTHARFDGVTIRAALDAALTPERAP